MVGQSAAPQPAYLPHVLQSTPPRIEPVFNLGGAPRALAVDGTRLAVGHGLGVSLVDLTDPAAPRQLGEIGPLSDYPQALVLRGDILAVVTESAELHLYDVTAPAAAQRLSSVALAGQPRDMALDGQVAYVGTGLGRDVENGQSEAGLELFDVTDPTNPRRLGQFRGPGTIQRILVRPPLVYLAAGWAGVLVVDVSDPRSPILGGPWDLGPVAEDLALANAHLVVLDEGQLAVLDLSDPGRPREVGRFQPDLSLGLGCLAAVGNTVYALTDGLLPVDVTEPTRPSARPVIAAPSLSVFPGRRSFVVAEEERVYVVASGGAGATVLDVGRPLTPRIIGQFPVVAHEVASELASDGSRLYAQLDQQVCVLDATDWPPGARPFPGLGAHGPMVAREGLLYLGDSKAPFEGLFGVHDLAPDDEAPGLRVIDARAPDQWRELARYEGLLAVWDLAIAADTLLGLGATRYDGGWLPPVLQSFDVAAPAAPSPRPALALTRNTSMAAISPDGGWAYVAEDEYLGDVWHGKPVRLAIVDLRPATGPVRVGALDLPWYPRDLAVDGSRLYVAASFGGLLIYDLADPGRPVPIGAFDTQAETLSVAPLGGQAVVAYADGLRWLDVSNPAQLRALAYQRTLGPRHLVVADDLVWVALEEGGLLGLRLIP